MNRLAVLSVVLLQLAVLSTIALKREAIMASGATVYLRTAPVDPRDLFRGDYVTLSYDIANTGTLFNNFMLEYPEEAKEISEKQARHSVYVPIEVDANGIATASGLYLEPPAQGLFIKGRMGKGTSQRWMRDRRIKFGIEKYFVEQGKGIEMEDMLGERDEWQRAMEVEVALGDDGTPVIVGHRWSDVSVRIEILEEANAAGTGEQSEPEGVPRQSAAVRFSIRNDTESSIQLPVSVAGRCELSVIKENNAWDGNGQVETIDFPARNCDRYNAGAYKIETLQPQQVYSVDIDFAASPWMVQGEDGLVELGSIPVPGANYRIHYIPPTDNKTVANSDNAIWMTKLSSARFAIAGWVD